MKFSETEPPTETAKNEFPVLDTYVTVSNCWYYLSLLERFVYATRQLEEEDLKMYLVRAEYRYHRWITERARYVSAKNAHTSVPPIGRAYILFKRYCI